MNNKKIAQTERQITIACITSTDYLNSVRDILKTKLVQTKEAKKIIKWCFDFHDEFKKAPENHIQDIYLEKLKNTNIPAASAEIIENILEDLSDQQDKKPINIDYLIKKTEKYCRFCAVQNQLNDVQELIENNDVEEAQNVLNNFKPVEYIKSSAIQPLQTANQIKNSFESMNKPLFTLPGTKDGVGSLVNQSFIKEGFVVFMGQNKAGKSYWLMKCADQAAKQGNQVAFFQAGDMSQAQMERRQAIALAKKSDLRKYCSKLYVPVLDCWYNLNGDCDLRKYREDPDQDYPFESMGKRNDFFTDNNWDSVKDIVQEYSDHKPCYNCKRHRKLQYNYKGAIWYKIRPEVDPLTWKQVYRLTQRKYKHLKNIRLITYASETLTMAKVNTELELLEKEGFYPGLIVIDYLDLLAPDKDTLMKKPNDQEHAKWQRARKLSQEKKSLVLSGSQSDADGFKVRFLSKSNFSTDRRKLDHVTAMYGLNMTIQEKKKGVGRLNDIVSREGEGTEYVYFTHRLQMGQPIINGFY